MGMSAHEYFHEDSTLVIGYREAMKIKQQQRNHEMWLQGMYVYEAVGCWWQLLNGNVKKPKALPYRNRPYPLTQEEIEEEQRLEQEQQAKAVRQHMEQLMVALNNEIEGRDKE